MTTHIETKHPFNSLSPATYRASTIVFDKIEDFVTRKSRQPDGYSYGTTGTPTHRHLEARIAKLSSADHCVLAPSGQAALVAAVLTFARAGDHVLLSEAAYGGLKSFASEWMHRLGIVVESYPADASAADIEPLIRPSTTMICLESPGSITMEMADVPAIAVVAKARGILTMMDNTWASPLAYKPLLHGVDLVVEAASKFFSGHSDLLMGSTCTNSFHLYEQLREAQATMGLAVGSDDCFLALRGLETYELRYREQSQNALQVARWLEAHPAVDQVLFPPLESDPGHAIWKRDFKGCGCLLSFVLKPASQKAFAALFESLNVFSIGASWGGTHSLIAFYPAELQRARRKSPTDGPVLRISVGLEPLDKLIEDLGVALSVFQFAKE
ncbi:PLP-dependent aspartate aminotransferase family protein (plasmid) [Burkholderia cepacia]|uniref:trans-sulfuration enzyme family protein n=1 Tax=Burkholderia cepacia TaxID=292 RepID=UPI003A4DD12C